MSKFMEARRVEEIGMMSNLAGVCVCVCVCVCVYVWVLVGDGN